jgi:hypothetical protein
MSTPPPQKVLADLWRAAGQPEAGLDAITLTGAEPALPSSFAVGTVTQATVLQLPATAVGSNVPQPLTYVPLPTTISQ